MISPRGAYFLLARVVSRASTASLALALALALMHAIMPVIPLPHPGRYTIPGVFAIRVLGDARSGFRLGAVVGCGSPYHHGVLNTLTLPIGAYLVVMLIRVWLAGPALCVMFLSNTTMCPAASRMLCHTPFNITLNAAVPMSVIALSSR